MESATLPKIQKPVEQWSTKDVKAYFESDSVLIVCFVVQQSSFNSQKFAYVVANEDIDGLTLLSLSEGALHDFHFSNTAKERVLNFVKQYNEQKHVSLFILRLCILCCVSLLL
jgi:hypothetical protein